MLNCKNNYADANFQYLMSNFDESNHYILAKLKLIIAKNKMKIPLKDYFEQNFILMLLTTFF